jgi:AICAR transformylase/IMP cyclohydrolase PurH
MASEDFEELRRAAFEKARDKHDIGFFWDLVKHLRSSGNFVNDDGSMGGIGAGITEAIEMVREMMGKDLGDDEPLIRAKLEDYLAKP